MLHSTNYKLFCMAPNWCVGVGGGTCRSGNSSQIFVRGSWHCQSDRFGHLTDRMSPKSLDTALLGCETNWAARLWTCLFIASSQSKITGDEANIEQCPSDSPGSGLDHVPATLHQCHSCVWPYSHYMHQSSHYIMCNMNKYEVISLFLNCYPNSTLSLYSNM